MESNQRAQWSNNLVFILAAIGSAIGMGNLWGFPYKMGANGGLPFLIIYLAMVILCGVIVMSVEMVIGRSTGKSPILAMTKVAKKWKFVGVFGVLCSFLIMGFYSVLIGYALRYFVGFLVQIFGASGFGGAATGADFFVSFTQNVPMVVLFTVLTFVLCGIIVAGGVKGGLEKFNKVGIPGLFVILILIIIYNFVALGNTEYGKASEGLKFMFTTWGLEVTDSKFDFFSALRTAGGQMLFSLSLGMGCMITYGSYLGKKENIIKNAWIIPAFDTLAAIMAGMAIFPAVFATGNKVNAGPGLLYMTMHDVFSSMGYVGNFVGMLFYLLVIFAGVSSAISLMEVAAASIIDDVESKGKKANRTRITVIVTAIMFVLSILVGLDQLGIPGDQGFFWPLYSFLGSGSQDLLDVFDLLAEGLLMPLGSILMCVVVGWIKGHDWMKKEVTCEGNKFHGEGFFKACVRYVTPVLMVFVLISLFLSYFGV